MFGALKIQQVANGILMATAAAIGLLCYFLGETKQRRAFLEAKQSLEVKMVIEEQSAEQVKNKGRCEFLFFVKIGKINIDQFEHLPNVKNKLCQNR